MDNLFFILSKVAWIALSPSNLIISFICLGTLFLIFNQLTLAKLCLIPTMLFSVTLLIYPISDYLMFPLENRFHKPEPLPKNIDGIIVLGGGEERKLSLDWKTAEMGLGGDRFIAAAKLAKIYPNAPVLFAGGSGLLDSSYSIDEQNIAEQLLTAVGINEQKLTIESRSRNTYENFSFIHPLLPKGNGQYLLVTSAFHMPRAMGIARKQGVNVIAYPVDYRSNSAEFRQYDFNVFDHLQVLEPAWREWIGLTVYYWTGKTGSWFPEMKS